MAEDIGNAKDEKTSRALEDTGEQPVFLIMQAEEFCEKGNVFGIIKNFCLVLVLSVIVRQR